MIGSFASGAIASLVTIGLLCFFIDYVQKISSQFNQNWGCGRDFCHDSNISVGIVLWAKDP